MAEFAKEKAYLAKDEGTYYNDGRETELLHFVYNHPSLPSFRGSPSGVRAAIDEYGRTKKWLMNVGEDKGKIVTDLIAELKPDTMVELGGYVGYSALLFGEALRKAGGRRYLSLERDPVFAAVVLSLVDLAGLSDIVKVVVGPSSDSIRRLHKEGALHHIDLLFLDHYKPAYISDLKLCEQLGLVKPGTVLAADNVIDPGNPPYLEYVRSSVAERTKRHQELGQQDERTRKQDGAEETQRDDSTVTGNPKLKYESTLMKSFEPTGVPDGVEVTRCVGEEK